MLDCAFLCLINTNAPTHKLIKFLTNRAQYGSIHDYFHGERCVIFKMYHPSPYHFTVFVTVFVSRCLNLKLSKFMNSMDSIALWFSRFKALWIFMFDPFSLELQNLVILRKKEENGRPQVNKCSIPISLEIDVHIHIFRDMVTKPSEPH